MYQAHAVNVFFGHPNTHTNPAAHTHKSKQQTKAEQGSCHKETKKARQSKVRGGEDETTHVRDQNRYSISVAIKPL